MLIDLIILCYGSLTSLYKQGTERDYYYLRINAMIEQKYEKQDIELKAYFKF
jgi:uncharacterized protein YxeA